MTDYANGSAPRILLRAYLTSDHISDATSKTIAVTISKNGGAFGNPAAGATNATEIANGWYYVDLAAGDTGTNGPLIIRGTAAATDTSECRHDIVPATNGRLSNLDAAISTVPTANANADALLDRAAGVETGMTPRQGLRLFASVLLGKISGAATTTNTFRDTNDSKNRVTATVDSDGNRTAITLDGT